MFLAPGDVRKGRVEPISWMRMCSAFAARGLDVSLVGVASRIPDGVRLADVWTHFGIAPEFRIRMIPTGLDGGASVLAFRLWAGLAATGLALLTLAGRMLDRRKLVVYARSPVLAAPFAALRHALPRARRPLVVLETHALPDRLGARVARLVDLVVVTSRALERDVVDRLGLPRGHVLYVPLGPYNDIRRHPRLEARAQLGLPAESAIACYTGKMLEDQNEFLLETAAAVKQRQPRFRLMLVGGNPSILEWTRSRVRDMELEDEVIVAGFVEPSRIDLYQAAADVLVFHMSSDLLHYEYCTPAKGFEYQAAGRPIVATDIPLFEEVFGSDGDRAIRVRERTPAALARAIEHALTVEAGGSAMAERAAAWVGGRTWERRADAVLEALGV